MKKIYPKKVGECRQCGRDIIAKNSSYASVGGRIRLHCSATCKMRYKNLHDNPAKRYEVRKKISDYATAHFRGMKRSQEFKDQNRLNNLGEKSHFWKGGKTKEAKLIRTSAKYNQWRLSVFQRDGFICQGCKVKGGYLNADHILAFADYPDKRFDLENGRTLCIECHKKTPTFASNLRNARTTKYGTVNCGLG